MNEVVRVRRAVVEKMLEHSKRDAPIEACGYLAAKNGAVVDAIPMRNVDASPESFTFDPAEQFAALKRARSDGAKLSGVYHSHPATPARPSRDDLERLRDPSFVYFIVSLAGSEPDLRAFRVRDGRSWEVKVEVMEER
ncbi:MAG: M67 family metallopeptidase [Promethearchaeota archaeon]